MTEAAPSETNAGPNAGAEALAGAAPAAAPAPGASDWFSSLSEPLRGQEPIKRFEGKSLDDLASGFLEQQKMARSRVPLPGETPESYAAFADAIRPADPTVYKIDVPEGVDPAYAEHMRGVFHKLGAPPQLVEGAVAGSNEFINGLTKAKADADVASVEAFKAEYRGDYQADLDRAKAALGHLGAPDDGLNELGDKWGSPALLAWAIGLADKVGPLPNVAGDFVPGIGAMTPEGASKFLEDKRADPDWYAKAQIPGSKEKGEWDAAIRIKAQARIKQQQQRG